LYNTQIAAGCGTSPLSELGGVLSFDCIYLADNKPQIFLAVFYITSAPRDREYTKKYCQGVVIDSETAGHYLRTACFGEVGTGGLRLKVKAI
jgi:hypothetical protein